MNHNKHSFYLFTSIVCIFSLILSSCEEVLYVTDISNEEVTLLAPSDGTELEFTSINFSWSPILDATSYQLQIATPNFSDAEQILVDESIDSLAQYTVDLNVNEYQWRVKALNSDYETPYKTASFKVVSQEDFSMNTVSLESPMDNLITNETEISLSWNSILGATSYTLEIEDNATQEIVATENLTATSLTYTFIDGEYTWRVRAEKDDEITLFASRSILVDTMAPNIPSLTMPENNAVLSETMVNFEWNREEILGSVEFDSIYIFQDENLEDLIEKDRSTSPYSSTLLNQSYYWIVKSFDEAGNESETSEIFLFSIN